MGPTAKRHTRLDKNGQIIRGQICGGWARVEDPGAGNVQEPCLAGEGNERAGRSRPRRQPRDAQAVRGGFVGSLTERLDPMPVSRVLPCFAAEGSEAWALGLLGGVGSAFQMARIEILGEGRRFVQVPHSEGGCHCRESDDNES